MDLKALQQKINSFTTVVSSWLKNTSTLYFSSTPAVVKVKVLDDHGKVVEQNIPNMAKIKADFNEKKSFSHSMGIGTVPAGNLNNGKGIAFGDGDTGFRQNGDGQLEMFANNRIVAKIYSNGFYNWREHYYEHWIRNNGTSASGLYWNNSRNPGFRWHIYPQNRADMTLRTGAGNGGIKGSIENDIARGYIHWTKNNEIGFLNNARQWALRVFSNKNVKLYGNLTLEKSNPFINFANTASGDKSIDVSIGVNGENFYIREPEEKGKEWFRIEDDKEAYVMGSKVNTTSNTKFHSGVMKATSGYGYITPPSGYAIGHLKAVIVANHITYFNGNVNGDDTLICRVRSNNDAGRIKVECRNSEQRGDAYFNFLTVWQK